MPIRAHFTPLHRLRRTSLLTAAVLATGALLAAGLTSTAAFADDDPTDSTANVTIAANGGVVSDTIVEAYTVTGTGPATQFTHFTDGFTGDGTDDSVNGVAPITGLVTGDRYVFRVDTPNQPFAAGSFSAPNTDPDDYAVTWYGSTAAYTPSDAGVFVAGTDADPTIGLLAGYSISGTVSDSTGAPADFTFATAFRADDTDPSAPIVQEGYTDGYSEPNGTGTYTIGGLRPGDYKLQFTPDGGSTDGYIWSGDATTAETASTVTIDTTNPVDLTGIDAQLGVGGSITGTLRAPGGAATPADDSDWIRLYEADGTTVATDDSSIESSDGAFEFDQLPAGDYYLQSNTLNTAQFGDYYSNAGEVSDATPVVVGSDPATSAGISMTLSAGFELTGTVTSSVGVAVAGQTVTAFPKDGFAPDTDQDEQQSFSVVTNAKGVYDFKNLAPESYYLEVTGPDDPASTYADQYVTTNATSTSKADAAFFDYATGTHTRNISLLPTAQLDIRMISPTGTLMTTGDAYVRQIVGGKWDQQTDIRAVPDPSRPGYYHAAGLTPGADTTYTVFLEPGSATNVTYPQYLGGSETADGAKTISLKPGLNTIDANFVGQRQISGTVTDALTGKPVPNVLVTVYSWDGTNWVRHASGQEGVQNQNVLADSTVTTKLGTYTFGDIQPGSYKLEFGAQPGDPEVTKSAPTQTMVPQFSGGASTLDDATPLYVSATANGVMNAKMVAGGVITGSLETLLGASVTSAEVVPYYLGSDGTSTPIADYEQSASVQGGSYKLSGLVPGVWKLAYVVNPWSTGSYSGWVQGDDGDDAQITIVGGEQQALGLSQVLDPADTTGTINVNVTDSDGNPVTVPWITASLVPTTGPDLTVCPSKVDDSTLLNQPLVLCGTLSADSNTASISGISPGDYVLDVKTQDYAGDYEYLPVSEPVSISAGSNPDVNVQLSNIAPITFTAQPTIDSTEGSSVGDTLIADDGTVNMDGTTTAFQWYRTPVGGSPVVIRGAQGAEYTLASGDFGTSVSVRTSHSLDLTDALGTVLYTYTGSAISAGVNVSASTTNAAGTITITGNPAIGSLLTADPSGWSVSGESFTYQWVTVDDDNDAAPITGATNAAYAPTAAAFANQDPSNLQIAVQVTGHRSGYPDAMIQSDPIAIPALTTLKMTVAPKITTKVVAGKTTYTASGGAWSPAGATNFYVWRVDGSDVATGPTWTPDVTPTGYVRLRVDAYRPGYADITNYFVAHKGTQVPTPSGIAVTDNTSEDVKTGDALSVNTGSWNYADGGTVPSAYRYQWYDTATTAGAKPVAIAAATKSTYAVTSTDIGKTISVVVYADSTNYATGSFTASLPDAVASNDALTGQGEVTGLPASAALGSTVRSGLAGWTTPTVLHTYQWQYEAPTASTFVNIVKATAASLVIPTTLVSGGQLQLVVTTTKAGYTTEVTTSGTITIDNQIRTVTAPTVTPAGPVKVGATLTANAGTVDVPGAVASYVWSNDGGVIAGAIAKTYVAKIADANTGVTVTVTWKKTGYTADTTAATNEVHVSDNIQTVTAPSIAGASSVKIGATLTVNPGTVDVPGAIATYTWSNGVQSVQTGASKTYVTKPADVATFSVSVTWTKAGFIADTVTGTNTVAVSNVIQTVTAPSVSPASGVKVGQTLTASAGKVDVVGAVATYAWSNDDGTIAGATGATYVTKASDAGEHVSATVTWTKANFVPVAVPSSDLVAVYPVPVASALPTPPTGVPLGSAVVGAPIAAPTAASAFNIPDTTPAFTAYSVTYQWYLTGKAIAKATTATYTPVATDVGHPLTVVEKFASTVYTSAAFTSAPTTVAAATIPDASVTITPAAPLRPGMIVTAHPGISSVAGLAYTYQWQQQSNGVWNNIVGATKSTYTVQPIDALNSVQVVMTATKAGYTSSKVNSTPAAVLVVGTIDSVAAAKLSASPVVGTAVTGAGTWDVTGLTYAYQWALDGVDIPGATTAAYIPLASQLGDGLSLRITASRTGYVPTTVTTNELNIALAAAPVMSATHKAVISGAAATCGSQSISPGLWNDLGLTVTYQWYRTVVVAGVTTITAIPAGTAATYQPVAGDNGATLKVVLTATSPATQTGTFTTTPTVAVAHCS